MPKVTLSDVTNLGGNPVSAQQVINTNSERIEAAIEKTLSRDGTSPNQMEADFDMNHYDILNAGTVSGDKFIIDGMEFEGTALWIISSGAPGNAVGKLGDVYLDSLTGNVYGPKTSSGWGSVSANIKGPQGIQGPQGVQGIQGVQGLQGMQGPQGLQGPQGVQGVQGEKGDSFSPDAIGLTADRVNYDGEPQGFSFLDSQTGYLYFKLSATSGDWSPGITFTTGPQGPVGPQGVQGPEGPQGVEGPQGPIGPAGVGVPTGGAAGQILTKNTGTDYDTSWQDPTIPNNVNIDTRSTITTTNIPVAVNYLQTAGYSSVGDGGESLFRRVGSEPSHSGKVQSADGAWWEIVLDGGIARVGQFGSGQAAVEAAHTVADVIIIDKEITVSTTATWPNGKSYMFTTGGKLSVSNGVTLTVGGVVHADTWQGLPSSNPRKIFDCTGTGKVVGIRSVKPEWWGAKGDGVSDDQPALQAAHDCVEQSQGSSGGRPEIVLRQATYGLGRTLSLRPTAHINLRMVGAGPIFGTRFTELSSFSTSNGSECIRIDGNSDNIEKIAGYDIGNFSVSGDVADGSSLVGVWVGGDGSSTDLIGVQQSSIHDVHVENFSFCWRIANCRLVDFDRCSGWSITIAGAVGALITVDAAGAFTGDINFNDCQFVVDPSNSGKCVSISNSTSGSEIKGIRFNNTIFYKGSRFFEIYCTAGNIGDIWVNPGCQFDGFGGDAVHIEGDGASAVIDSVHVLSTYIRGINANSVGVQVSTLNGANVRDIHVTGNQIFSLLTGARAIVIGGGVKGGVVANNIITDIDNPANEAILIDGSRFSVVSNVLNRSGTQYTAWLVTLGTSSSYCIADNNIGSGIVATATVRNLGTDNVVGTSNK